MTGYRQLAVLSFMSCKFIADFVGYTESLSTKRSPILRVWLIAILWLLVLRLDCPWALSYQGRTTVNFKDSGKELLFLHTQDMGRHTTLVSSIA